MAEGGVLLQSFRRSDLLGVPQAPCPSLSVPDPAGRLSISTSLLSLTAITHQALPTRHQVTDKPMHRNLLYAVFQQASFPLQGTSALPFTWCGVLLERGRGKCLLLNQRLLEEERTWSLLLQLPPCCHAAFLNRVSSAGMLGSELRPCALRWVLL